MSRAFFGARLAAHFLFLREKRQEEKKMDIKHDDYFEKTFRDFIERHEYDEAEAALFKIVREAYKAGYLAAKGEPLLKQEPKK